MIPSIRIDRSVIKIPTSFLLDPRHGQTAGTPTNPYTHYGLGDVIVAKSYSNDLAPDGASTHVGVLNSHI